MTRAIITCMHSYQPYGQEFYGPILDFFLQSMQKYKHEYDRVYILEDTNWEIDPKKLEGLNAKIIRVDPHLRYYDAYKEVLPLVGEDLVLFMDCDMVVNKEGIIKNTFNLLDLRNVVNEELKEFNHSEVEISNEFYDVVSITDTIGTMKVPLKTGNKLCPYFFATRRDLLMKYLDIDWSPDAMPYTETFGLLTEAMLKDGARVYEMEDDKTNFPTKDLGYYHIRSGSTPAWLLAEKHYGNLETYWNYLRNQPKSEYLRQNEWYRRMGGNPTEIIEDSKDL